MTVSNDPQAQESAALDLPVIQDQPCVLIVNLGTPDSPTAPDVRRYLREFLSDRRVVETHPAIWRPILEGIILRVRPKASAEKYATVWQEDGSPLLVYTKAQAEHLSEALTGQAEIRYAMRYGSNNIKENLDQIYADGYRKLLVIPLYPQYSATTVASISDEIYRWNLKARDQFDLRVLRSFPVSKQYIDALVQAIENSWNENGKPDFENGDRLVLSYHGIPKSMHLDGDPYPFECEATTKQVAERLGISGTQIVHTYQSVFGPAEWLKPATIDTVEELGKQGTRRIDVVCPGFVSDCLETLEEINQLNRETFIEAGGQEFHYIPWGNNHQPWLEALEKITNDNLAGWAK